MNILLTGATGLLGSYIVRSWNNNGILACVYVGSYSMPDTERIKYYKTDIRDRDGLEHIFRDYKIDVVIHAAGEARVDYCEKNYDDAYSTNVLGTKKIINMCKKYGAKLIYISTNAVFDGTKPPYKEEDSTGPVNTYGRIKLECENLVRAHFKNFLLIRPILMYGWNRPQERDNVATWILRKLQEGEQVKLVDDIFDNPLHAFQCAEVILKLVEKNKNGIYHIGGEDIVDRYQFGLILAEIFGYDRNLIAPVKNEYFKDIAPRPKNTCYDTQKIRYELGIKPLGIRDGLLKMLKERKSVRQESAV